MLALVVWVTLAIGTSRAQEPFSTDTWIPVDEPASAALVRGDGQAKTALAGGRGADLAWDKAFEAWSAALRESEPGVAVAAGARDALGVPMPELSSLCPDNDGTAQRRHESLEYAVLRRLSGLPAAALERWTRLQAPRAEAVLEAALADERTRRRELLRVEREFPATHAALRAALELFELEFEAGRALPARSWLERAQRHGKLARVVGIDAPIAARRAALARPALEPTPPAWTTASDFEPELQHTLVLPNMVKPKAFARIDGPAGITHLSDERLVVQTSDRVWVLARREEDRAFEPAALARELLIQAPRNADRPGRGWPLFPASDGEHLYVLAGRADGTTSNLVQRVAPPRELELPELIWSLGGDRLYHGDDELVPLDEVLGPGLWEFQPGPVVAGDVLLVQARQWTQVEQDGLQQVNSPGEARSWLLALELSNGRPRWRRLICRGTDVIPDLGARFGRGELIRTPAAPLVLVGERVFVGTHLGAGALVDLADGRLAWSFLVERRDPDTPGWQNLDAPIVAQEAGRAPLVLWAPRDAAELYALRGALDFDREDGRVLARPPLAIGEAERLVGGDAELALTYGRAGSRRTLSAHELSSGRRYDSVFLGREEHFLGRALVSPLKVLCLTDRGLYRFDRTRELYLERLVPLRLDSRWAAGGIWEHGSTLHVLASGGLFSFSAR